MRTLIVDDKKRNRMLMEEILSDCSSCVLADNGKEAVGSFQKAWEDGKPFDLVCLDIDMPIVDGMRTLKVIRKLEEKMGVSDSERTRIIMVTARFNKASSDLCHRLGCDGYFIKPINRLDFMAHVVKLQLIP